MRRKELYLGLAALLVVCTTAFAGGSGNCVQPIKTTTDRFGVGAAFGYNYVKDRMNNLDNKDGPSDMKVENLSQIYGTAIIGLSDSFNLYAKAGGCKYDLEFVDYPQNALMSIELKDGVYAGAGINTLYPLTEAGGCSFGIGADVQGNFFYNDVRSITRSGELSSIEKGSFFGIDGQNSVYLTCKYEIEKLETSIVPYIGGYHSWMIIGTVTPLDYNTPLAGNVEEEDYQPAFDLLSFGLLLGVDVEVTKYVNLNVEGRFIGETALTTGATIKF